MIHNATSAAKEIRKVLKMQFPGIKFSVTSKYYSMGSSIYVRWAEGPEVPEVEKYAKRFQYGYFNAMDDTYEYESEMVIKDDGSLERLGGAKYVICMKERD